jgi:hypothetical protein
MTINIPIKATTLPTGAIGVGSYRLFLLFLFSLSFSFSKKKYKEERRRKKNKHRLDRDN